MHREKNIGLSNTRRRRKTKEGAYSHFSFLPWYSFRGATHLQEGRRNWFMALRCTLLYLPCFSSLAAMNHYANLFFCLSPVLEVQQNCTKSEFHQNHFTRSFPNFSGLIFDFGEINILKIFLKNSPAAFALKLYENILHGIQLPGIWLVSRYQKNNQIPESFNFSQKLSAKMQFQLKFKSIVLNIDFLSTQIGLSKFPHCLVPNRALLGEIRWLFGT